MVNTQEIPKTYVELVVMVRNDFKNMGDDAIGQLLNLCDCFYYCGKSEVMREVSGEKSE